MPYINIREIEIENFKGLRGLKIEGLGAVNFFIGKNNSGKTSILEALNAFFCKPYFSSNLMPPPSIVHYNKEGDSFPNDIKITIKFQLSKDFYDAISPDDRKILQEKYEYLVVSKEGMSKDMPPEKINELYVIKNGEELGLPLKKRLDELVWPRLSGYYSDKVIFSSSMDGFRTNPNMEAYYRACYNNIGTNQADTCLRGSIAAFTAELVDVQNSDRKNFTRNFLKGHGEFSPMFSKTLDARSGGVVNEFGDDENIQSNPFYSQGDGELDTFELLRGLEVSQFNDKDTGYRLCIMDEPENHKHPSLQRKLLNRIIKVATEKQQQFFICTHSTIFASRPLDSQVYLITRDESSDKNFAKAIASSSNAKDLKKELGLLNTDYFFSNAILFVEGKTEEEIFPALFKYHQTDENSLGLKIVNVDGNDNVNRDRLRETLKVLEDTDIKPIIALDNENNAEKNRGEILKANSDLFLQPDLQYHLWDSSFFVNALPTGVVLTAFNKMLDSHGYGKTITEKNIDDVKVSGKSVENFLQRHCMDKFKLSLSKTELARYIAEEIYDIPEGEKGNMDDNEVLKHTKAIVEFMKEITETS